MFKNSRLLNIKHILLFIFLFICIFSLSACGLLKQVNCEHVWEEEVETEATCISDGVMLKTCTICGKTMHAKIPASGHAYEEIEKVDPTCTEEGHSTKECKYCHTQIIETIPAKGHNIVDGVGKEATCEDDGYTAGVCLVCEQITKQIIPALGHDYTEWEIITSPSSSSTGLKKRTCNRCGKVEEAIIPMVDYINLDVLEYDFPKKSVYDAESEDEFVLIYSAAILNRNQSISVNINFSYDDFNAMFSRVKERQSVQATYSASASMVGHKLTITFTYPDLPSLSTTSDSRYTQLSSLNAYNNTRTRSDDFNDFEIEKSGNTYTVSTSSQLVYVLERAYKPTCVSGSSAEAIYNKAKQVLREIINDNMTDVEKVRAIHDYLVMNVTYDNALCDLLYENVSNLKSYNGFYLEGVFNDHYAVCEGISNAFVVLANIEGIPCVQVTGYSALNPSGAGHAWNKIFVDGKWYIIDATSDGTILNDKYELLSYEYFLISEETMMTSKNKYVGNDFNDITCNDTFDPYDAFTYDGSHKFKVKSFNELKSLVKAFNDLGNKAKSAQIVLDYAYVGSASNEVSRAYNANLISSSFSYVENGEVFTIIENTK